MKTKYAFFDVDETLLKIKTIFEFFRYYIYSNNQLSAEEAENNYNSFLEYLNIFSKDNTREEVNAHFYKVYKDTDIDKLFILGNEWWNSFSPFNKIFNEEVLKKFYWHQSNGYRTVLVSGSMECCLLPLKHYLNADFLICTSLEIIDGKLTGELLGKPNIGEGKANNILKLIDKNFSSTDFLNSYAYGDHSSDIPMLKLVGNQYMVVNFQPTKYN